MKVKKQPAPTNKKEVFYVPLSRVGRAVMTTYVRHIADQLLRQDKSQDRKEATQKAEQLFIQSLDTGKIIQWGCVGRNGTIPAFEGAGQIEVTI